MYGESLWQEFTNIKHTERQFGMGVFLQQIYVVTHQDIPEWVAESCESVLRRLLTGEVAESNLLEGTEWQDDVTEERFVIAFPDGSRLRVSSHIVRLSEVLLRLHKQKGKVIPWYTNYDFPLFQEVIAC
jgi:hypothetical protein